MPEVVATRGVGRPLADVWTFVEDMDHWAPMLKGYVAHAKTAERESDWTLAGELGPFSRTVKLRVKITEWTEHKRVAFELDGIDEAVHGTGSFDLSETRPELPVPAPRTWWQRVIDWLFGAPPPPVPSAPAQSHVTFTFSIEALGPMGPMIDALLGPYAEAVAHDLLETVGSHLESV